MSVRGDVQGGATRYGAACLAGQDENGALALTAVLPIPRRTILVQKVWAMALQALLLAAAVTVASSSARASS